MKVIDLDNRIIFVDTIISTFKKSNYDIYGKSYYNYYVQTTNDTYSISKDKYDEVNKYLLSLNDKVEIEEEKKIPERLEEFNIQGLEVSGYSMTQAEYLLENGVNENREMINCILDYLKSKGNK